MDFFQLSRTTLPTASKRLFVFGGVGLLVVTAVLFAYFGTEISANERKGSKGPPAIPVSVAQVAQEVVPFRLQAIGNVEAYATVSVKARVPTRRHCARPKPTSCATRRKRTKPARRSAATRSCSPRISSRRRPTRKSAPTPTPPRPWPRGAVPRSTTQL